MVVRYTNKKATAEYKKYSKKKSSYDRMWRQEIYAFLGILIMSGTNNSNTDHTTDMWKSTAYPLHSRATMKINRFWNILRFIQFDDSTRITHIKENKTAPIQDLWIMLNSNLLKLYRPLECLIVNEQFFSYREWTKFTQYIEAKYGMKIWWICDTENLYSLRGQYTGKSEAGRESN